MLFSTYRPALAPNTQPVHINSGYADDYSHHPHPHPSCPGAGTASASSSSTSVDCDRFEYRGTNLVASLLETRLAANALVRDCSVIGVPQPGGVAITSSPGHRPLAGTVPIAFVALSFPGRERSAQGGDKESKRMKNELLKWIVDFAPAFKQIKGKLMFVESIPRGAAGSVLRHLLVEKATSPPAPGPDKGFFNTVLSEAAAPAGPSRAPSLADPTEITSPPKRAVRDSKRRATHSQIERRRREKINDRLVTLRSIVPACAKELEERRRQKQEEEAEAARIAAGGAPKTYIDAATGKPKRKRNRKKPDAKKAATAGDKEEELGLHKLEVLTHAINYIFELKAHIHKLETGASPVHVPTADNPFGVKNRDGSYRHDAKVEDEPGCGLDARVLGPDGVNQTVDTKPNQRRHGGNDEEDEEDEVDQNEDDAAEGDGEGDDEGEDFDDDEDEEPLERRPKKHMTSASMRPSEATLWHQSLPKQDSFIPPSRYRRTDTAYSSSSSRESAEVSPAFSLIQQSPSTISPATTVTSPMMSLSAESPIMLPDPAISITKRGGTGSSTSTRVTQTPAFTSLPSSALPLPAPRRESSSLLFKQLTLTSPNFPAFNPSPYPASSAGGKGRSGTLSFPAYGEESEMRETAPRTDMMPGLSDRTSCASDASDASAAALLLNFSTSPEVLRPIGSHRTTSSLATSPHTRPVMPLPTNRSRSTFSSPQHRPVHPYTIAGKQEIEGEEGSGFLHLASPPHLALDSSPIDNDADEADRLSDKTVEELPSTIQVESKDMVVETSIPA